MTYAENLIKEHVRNGLDIKTLNHSTLSVVMNILGKEYERVAQAYEDLEDKHSLEASGKCGILCATGECYRIVSELWWLTR